MANGEDAIFNATFGGANQDVARSVVRAVDGGYVTAGWTMSFGTASADFWLVKTDASGNLQWNRTYGGAGEDKAYSVQKTSDSGYIVAGSTASYGSGLDDSWLVKTDANGVMQWSRTYGGVNNDYSFCVRQADDGGYVLAGYTDSFGAGSSDFWLVKTDGDGNMQWNKTYGGTGEDRAFSADQTVEGGYVIVGETDSYGAGNLDFWIVKTDSTGNDLWSRTYGGSNLDAGRAVKQTSNLGYVIAGWTRSFGAGGADFWLVKVDSSGYLQWNRTYGGAYDEEAYAIQQTSDGGFIAAGSTTTYGLGGWDFWQVKTDANGNTQWNQANGGASDDLAYSVQQTGDGGFILVGSTESFGAGLADFWLTKNVPPPPRPPEEDHDVAVMGVLPSRMIVGEGMTMAISVTVANLGRHQESTIVSVYANATVIDTYQIFLWMGQSQTLDFTWDTYGFAKGSYRITAVADPVLGESDSARANNILNDGEVLVTITGDIQGDQRVDALDLLALNRAYSSDPSKPNWNLYCDLNDDSRVDLSDLQLLGRNFGKTSG
jgi:hypothetical protein